MDGVVSLPFFVPVKMLQDTAASCSFTLRGTLPFSIDSAVGTKLRPLGFDMKGNGVSLHRVSVTCEEVKSAVKVVKKRGLF